MAKNSQNRQAKVDRIKAQLAENAHPQQSTDRKKRLEDAQKAADNIIAQSLATTATK